MKTTSVFNKGDEVELGGKGWIANGNGSIKVEINITKVKANL